MNPFKNLRTATLCIVTPLIVVILVSLLASAYQPSDSLVKALVEKQMAKRLKDATIITTSVVRGRSFPSQAHNSKVPFGTTLYPVVVKVVYTTPLPDGSHSENKELTRTLNLYKDASHHWVNDDELH